MSERSFIECAFFFVNKQGFREIKCKFPFEIDISEMTKLHYSLFGIHIYKPFLLFIVLAAYTVFFHVNAIHSKLTVAFIHVHEHCNHYRCNQ